MKVAICGCAINCAKYIDEIFKNISLMSQKLKISHIIISYDESQDDTLKKLERFEKYSNIVHIIKTDKPLTNNRIQNITNSRNRIMNFLSGLEKKPDYYIMMNFDNSCCEPLDLNVLKSAFKIKEEWDSISFNNEQYHDYWALSFDEFIFSCWNMPNPKDIMKDMNLQLKKKLKKQKYIEVDSAYNGFAIYRTETFINERYQSMIDFSIFDKNFKGIPKQFDKIIIDGNLEDSCIKVLKSYEKAINQEQIGPSTLEIVKMIAPSLDFIKFCYKQRLIKK